MLDFSGSHILIVLLVALVVVGPKDLPRLMRMAGQWAAKARQMLGQLRKTFGDIARESELDELRKEIGKLRNERPLANVEAEVNQALQPKAPISKPPVQQVPAAAPNEARTETRDGALKPSAP